MKGIRSPLQQNGTANRLFFADPFLRQKHRILIAKYFMYCLHWNYTAEMSVLK